MSQPQNRGSMLPKEAPIAFLSPRSIGNPIRDRERPQIAHVTIVDLDRDGLIDVVACDVLQNRVVWIRQSAGGMFTEIPIGDAVQAPAHAEAADLDRDGDLDVLVASLGVLFPSNARIGAVIVLENYAPPSGRPWHGVQWIENKGALTFVRRGVAARSASLRREIESRRRARAHALAPHEAP